MKKKKMPFRAMIALAFSIVLAGLLAAGSSTEGRIALAEELPDSRQLPRLVDGAGLLSEEEREDLTALLDEISLRQQCDVAVVTATDTGGQSPRDFADDFYDYNGYGMGNNKDGILFLLSMQERDWYITTTGFGIRAITDRGLEYIAEKFLPSLREGEYAKGFEIYANLCDSFLTQAKTGEPYDVGNLPREPLGAGWLVGSLAAGLAVGAMVTAVMKGRLKTVYGQAAASTYLKEGSLQFTDARELLLYQNITRQRRAQESGSHSSGGSSTHTSSSGRSHGGGGGKF